MTEFVWSGDDHAWNGYVKTARKNAAHVGGTAYRYIMFHMRQPRILKTRIQTPGVQILVSCSKQSRVKRVQLPDLVFQWSIRA